MGLDLCLERVSALKNENSKDVNRISIDNFENECETIKKIAIIKEDQASYYDIEKIAETYNMDEKTIYCCGFDSENSWFRDVESEELIKISNKEIEEKYIIKKEEKFYFYETEEVAYQCRGLNEIGWELLEKLAIVSIVTIKKL